MLLAAGILGAQLFAPPRVGLADNGDFLKVMDPAGLGYTTDVYEERYWQWTLPNFAIVEPGPFPGEYRTSETLLAKAAVAGSRLLSSSRLFDIRAMGIVHSVLFLAFLGLLGVAVADLGLGARLLALGLSVFCFTDVGYVAPFNSFYSQTASLLFLLLTLATAAIAIRRGKLDGWLLLAYFGFAALFVCSKPQESIQGPLLALLGLRLSGVRGRGAWRRLAGVAAASLCAISFWYYAVIPRRTISEVGLYHTVFMELLPASREPGRDLSDLGLDPGLARFSGVTAYEKNTPLADPAFRAAFFARIGYGGVLRFYLARPGRFMQRLRLAGQRAFQLRPGNLANFDRQSGFPPGTLSRRFDAWSAVRARLGGAGGLLWVVLLLAFNGVAAFRLLPRTERGRLVRDVLAIVSLMAAVEFLVCSLADYLGDVSRHLYVFQAMCDLLLIADLVWLAQIVGGGASRVASSPSSE